MAIEFHKLNVSKIVRETEDAVSVAFEIPDSLQTSYRYKPGQYLTVKAQVNGSQPRRSYSLCSSPLNGEAPTITVKKVKQGVMSTFLTNVLRVGDTLEVMPPMGTFCVDLEPGTARHYVLIGAGSGITPLMSILKSVLEGEPKSRITLLYGNRRRNSIIFYEALEALHLRYANRLDLVHILSQPGPEWSGLRGRLDADCTTELLRQRFDRERLRNNLYYVCGPSAMMEEVTKALKALGVPDDRLHREFFTTPVTGLSAGVDGANTAPAPAAEAVPPTSEVTVSLYGDTRQITVTPDETILEAGMRAGLDPPFACQVGACCTCRAKLISGKVAMDEREALTDEEIEEGYILTCQAHPLTAQLVVDYDQ